MSHKFTVLLLVALLAAVLVAPVHGQDNVDYTETDVRFENGEITLAGTLSLPAGPGPHPAVILISGSGPSDRDESLEPILTMRPFALLADAFASAGVAVLRYDDRGVGESTGNYQVATSADLATDAQAAFAFLQTRPEIDAERVGLLGHSEGGLIAALVAAENSDVAFVVSMAGPAVPGYDILMFQVEHLAADSGVDEATREAMIAEQQLTLDLIRDEKWDELEALMRDLLPEQLAAMPEERRAAMPDIEVIIEESMNQYRYWMHYYITHDPAEDWRRVQSPVLALFGGLDVQVPSDMNAPVMAAALETAAVPYTIAHLPSANHLFQAAETGSPTEYGTLEQTYTPEFIPTILNWVHAQVR